MPDILDILFSVNSRCRVHPLRMKKYLEYMPLWLSRASFEKNVPPL